MRTTRVESGRKRLAREGAPAEVDDLGAFRAPRNDRINAKRASRIGLVDLPGAGAAQDDREGAALSARANGLEHPSRVERVDRLARGSENRRIDTGRERGAQRVMGGHRNNRVRSPTNWGNCSG